jgi:cytochrome P450
VHDAFHGLTRILAEDPSIACYQRGRHPSYLVNSPEFVRHALVENHDVLTKDTPVNRAFKRAVADGLLVSEGDVWQDQRRQVAAMLQPRHVARFGPDIVALTLETVLGWPAEGSLEITEEMNALILRITSRTLFGADLRGDTEARLRDMADGLRSILSPHQENFQRGRAALSGIVDELIEARQDRPGDTSDLLGALLGVRDDDGEPLSAAEVRDQVMTVLMAGIETTANALTWTWYLLARHPEQRRAVQEEVDALLRAEPDAAPRPPRYEDLAQLPRTRMVFDEALRLFPPAWIIGRRTTAPLQFGETTVDEGSVVAVCPYVLQRDDRFWKEPDDFDPERFSAQRRSELTAGAYLPFGAGPRVCVGRKLALVEAVLVLATVLSHRQLDLEDNRPIEPERLFVLRPRGGLRMRVTTHI